MCTTTLRTTQRAIRLFDQKCASRGAFSHTVWSIESPQKSEDL